MFLGGPWGAYIEEGERGSGEGAKVKVHGSPSRSSPVLLVSLSGGGLCALDWRKTFEHLLLPFLPPAHPTFRPKKMAKGEGEAFAAVSF